MAFTTWAALKTSILDAIADSIAGKPCVGEYTTPTGINIKYRSHDELLSLYKEVCVLEAKTTGPRSSFGRYRRFR